RLSPPTPPLPYTTLFRSEARPHGQDPSTLLDAALRGGVDIVQLRDKELPDEELVRAAEPFRRVCDAHGALFVLNDRPDLVERCRSEEHTSELQSPDHLVC